MPNKKNTTYGYYKKITISLDVEDTAVVDELSEQTGLPPRAVIQLALSKLKEQTKESTNVE